MKKMRVLIGVGLVALFTGCNKIKQIANINVDIPYTSQVSIPQVDGYTTGIPLPPGGISLPFPAISVATNAQQYIAQYHTSTDKILNVYLKSMELDILSPPAQNFNFVDSIQIFISSKGLPEMLIAYAYNIPKGDTTLNLSTVTSVNLKNYFIQDTIILRMNAHINATPAPGTQLSISSVFHLLANPLE